MTTEDQIAELRRKISEPDTTTYSDDDLNTRLDANGGDTDKVAAIIWREKAASYSELVDISEAGSSRKNSQLYQNALAMAKTYEDASSVTAPVAGEYATTRPIRRA